MGVFALTVVIAFLLAALIWYVVGSRFGLSEDPRLNELYNVVAYFVGLMPIALALIYTLLR